jgi:hypothetical protein
MTEPRAMSMLATTDTNIVKNIFDLWIVLMTHYTITITGHDNQFLCVCELFMSFFERRKPHGFI